MTHVTNCQVDADGFCQAHGWDCADYLMFLDEKEST